MRLSVLALCGALAATLAALVGGCSTSSARRVTPTEVPLTGTPATTDTPTATPSPTPTARGWVYAFGGDAGGQAITDCWAFRVNNNGSIGPWVAGTPMPAATDPGGSVSAFAEDGAGHLFLAGGFEGFAFARALSTAYSANVATGMISNWAPQTPLPTPVYAPCGFARAGWFHVIGGGVPGVGAVSSIYSAPVSSGSLGPWISSAPLPAALDFAACVPIGSHAFVIGGFQTGTRTNTVRSAPFDGSGFTGSWVATSPLPITLDSLAAASDGSVLYVAGGNTAGYNGRSSVYAAPVTAPGQLGAWVSQPPLPLPLAFFSLSFRGGYLYALGGWTAAIPVQSAVYVATVSSGIVGPWTTAGFYPHPINDHAAFGGN